MGDYLKNDRTNGFTHSEFVEEFWEGKNCYFLAKGGAK
jgi:hypothetical protein